MKKIFNAGFTLVELLIVIAILGILAVGLLVALDPVEQTRRAQDTGALTSAGEIKAAILRYYASKQYFPWCSSASAGGACTYLGTNGCTADGATFAATSGTCANYMLSTAGPLVSSGELKTAPPGPIANRMYLITSSTGTAFQVSFVPNAKSFKTQYASSAGQPGIYNTATLNCSTAVPGDATSCPSTSAVCQYCVF